MTITENYSKKKSKKTDYRPQKNTDEAFDKLKENNIKEKIVVQEKESIIIGDYSVNSSGVYYHPPSENNNSKAPIWISSAIYPEAYLRDSEGKSHSLLIKVYDGEINHHLAMPRKSIMDWRDISNTLLDIGQNIPTNPSKQKLLQKFLMLARPQKTLRCVNKAGWHGNQYVLPDGTVIGKEKDGESVYPITQVCPEGIKEKGTLKEWQDNIVSICKYNSRLIFALGIAFASPCAELVNEDSGGFNYKGESSTGKTKCLKIAVSIWGSPEYKRSWKTTGNALEGICALYNDALLPLDEFGQADAKEIGEIAYMISQGIGKGRMNSNSTLQKLKTWRVIVISTGEVGLAEHMQEKGKKTKAGQLARFADIPSAVPSGFGCFENIHDEYNGKDFADKIDELCANYYGTASRQFVFELVNNIEEARRYLKYTIDDFVADNARDCEGQVSRVAKRFGIVLASLKLAIRYKTLAGYITEDEANDAVVKCFKAWLEDRGTKGNLESKQIIESILGKLHEYSDSRFPNKNPCMEDKKKTYQQIWGYKEGSIFYIHPNAFKEYFCLGQNSTDVAKALNKEGYLERSSDGKYSTNQRISAHSKDQDRFYTIQVNQDNKLDEKS